MNNDRLEKLKDLINNELKQGKSLKSILKRYGVQKKDFNKIEYTYNTDLKQFIKVVQEVIPEVEPKVIPQVVRQEKDNVSMDKDSIKVKEEVSIDIIHNDNKELINNNDYVNSNLDILAEMIKEYKKTQIINENKITIELPQENINNFKTSIRVNHIVWEQFKEFCNGNKQFKQVELLSLEYMNKHK